MAQKFYVLNNGSFAGAIFHLDPYTREVSPASPKHEAVIERVEPEEIVPEGFIAVPAAPTHPTDRWDFQVNAWVSDMHSLRAEAKKKVSAYAEAIGRELVGDVPQSEQQGWPAKESAARAYLADNASEDDVDLLESEANLTGESLDELANAILAKANAFRKAVAMIAGIRRKTEAAIDAAIDKAALDDLLVGAKLEADAALTGLLRKD